MQLPIQSASLPISSVALLVLTIAGCSNQPASHDFRTAPSAECVAVDGDGGSMETDCETEAGGDSSASTTGTSATSTSTGGSDESSTGCDTDGETCVCEPNVIPEFCEDDLIQCSCPAPGPQPVSNDEPGPNPTDRFKCPINHLTVPYCRLDSGLCSKCDDGLDEDDNPTHFDCDDYALACTIWGRQQDPPINVCQVGIAWKYDPPIFKDCIGKNCKRKRKITGGAHAINVVEFDDEYCLIEPQRPHDKDGDDGKPSQRLCCWPKEEGKDIEDIPQSCMDDYCKKKGAVVDETCRVTDVHCETTMAPNAGEEPFWTHPKICEKLDGCIDLSEHVCNCSTAVEGDANRAKGWTCLPNTCKFYKEGLPQEDVCHCNWSIPSGTNTQEAPSPIP